MVGDGDAWRLQIVPIHSLLLLSPLSLLQRITKAINRNVEMVSSARALKAGDTFSVKDIKVGKWCCMLHGDCVRSLVLGWMACVGPGLNKLNEPPPPEIPHGT